MVIPLLAVLASVAGPVGAPPEASLPLDRVFEPIAARGLHEMPGEPRELAKREEWCRDKEMRPDLHLSDAALAEAQHEAAAAEKKAAVARRRGNAATAPLASMPLDYPGVRIQPVTTLFNVWTHKTNHNQPDDPKEPQFHVFLRDHYTN